MEMECYHQMVKGKKTRTVRSDVNGLFLVASDVQPDAEGRVKKHKRRKIQPEDSQIESEICSLHEA